mmetsp:Transcript_31321/g.28505  ORF Transcript_31321/g.28505 Transcript_31321/m.28505 type:complete len:243 (-) Transcript_31321:347-1075(-)
MTSIMTREDSTDSPEVSTRRTIIKISLTSTEERRKSKSLTLITNSSRERLRVNLTSSLPEILPSKVKVPKIRLKTRVPSLILLVVLLPEMRPNSLKNSRSNTLSPKKRSLKKKRALLLKPLRRSKKKLLMTRPRKADPLVSPTSPTRKKVVNTRAKENSTVATEEEEVASTTRTRVVTEATTTIRDMARTKVTPTSSNKKRMLKRLKKSKKPRRVLKRINSICSTLLMMNLIIEQKDSLEDS